MFKIRLKSIEKIKVQTRIKELSRLSIDRPRHDSRRGKAAGCALPPRNAGRVLAMWKWWTAMTMRKR